MPSELKSGNLPSQRGRHPLRSETPHDRAQAIPEDEMQKEPKAE